VFFFDSALAKKERTNNYTIQTCKTALYNRDPLNGLIQKRPKNKPCRPKNRLCNFLIVLSQRKKERTLRKVAKEIALFNYSYSMTALEQRKKEEKITHASKK